MALEVQILLAPLLISFMLMFAVELLNDGDILSPNDLSENSGDIGK